ncbi:glycosyltransferase [Brucella cytisi]|uniref:glycosyltransferase n=2 Tax=Brucella cytisi TaxID=407152 RepID=UPI00313D8188
MRIAIGTLGTRGDVQPYLALARALSKLGHQVQLKAPQQFSKLAALYGVEFAPLPGDFLTLLNSPEGQNAVAKGRGFSAGFRLLKHVKPIMESLLEAEWNFVRDFRPDLIVYHPKSLASLHMAEALRIPAILASPIPGFTPTSEFPSPLLPFRSLGPLNKMSHRLAIRGADILFARPLREWRASSLGLVGGHIKLTPDATVYGYSRHVVPVPDDWNGSTFVSGFWFLDGGEQWQMPDPLAAFLRAGEKPFYVGFGSMPPSEPDRLTAIITEGLRKAGKRGILLTGNGALGSNAAADHVICLPSAPHDALFQHVAAALHHGGAGTTGASLRAGLPTAIMPFFGDQPFWARRVKELGVGPSPIDRKAVTSDHLARIFRELDDQNMQQRAGDLAKKIHHEGGVEAAARFIDVHARYLRLA